MIPDTIASRGKPHGLSLAMTEELFWAYRYAKAKAPVHFHAVGRARRTVEALERRGLVRRKHTFGRVISAKGRRLAERLFS